MTSTDESHSRTPPVSESANAETARKYFEEVLSTGELNLLDELVAADVVHHAAMPGQSPGRAGLREVATTLRTAFPDFTISIHDLIAKDDKVAVRMSISGTHRGALGELAATGRRVQFEELVILRLQGGKLAELWSMPDRLAMLTQLGVIDLTA